MGTQILIVCRECWKLKDSMTAEVIGAVDMNGDILVKRYHNGITRVSGDNLKIQCERCQTGVSILKERRMDEITNQWTTWIFRKSLNGTPETLGTFGSTHTTLGTN